MEREKANKILDDIYIAVSIMQQHEDYICSSLKEVHMTNCLREIAEAMDLSITEEPWECEGMMATKISFVYEDVNFLELENYRKCDRDAR